MTDQAKAIADLKAKYPGRRWDGFQASYASGHVHEAIDEAVSISRASQGSEGSAGDVERAAREIDPDAWKGDIPIPARDDVISFHARRQSSCEVARRVISALSPPATPNPNGLTPEERARALRAFQRTKAATPQAKDLPSRPIDSVERANEEWRQSGGKICVATPQAPEDVREAVTIVLRELAQAGESSEMKARRLSELGLLVAPVTVTMEELRRVLAAHTSREEQDVYNSEALELAEALRRVLGDHIQISGEQS